MTKPKTIYDRRLEIDERVRDAASNLYWALKNLLQALEERPDMAGIESVTISAARAALSLAESLK